MTHSTRSSGEPVGVGVIGAGVISQIYLKNLTTRFPGVRVIGVADIVAAAAEARAAEFGIAALTVDELLAHPEIGIVLNLTIPSAHYPVAMQAVAAGKSVYTEKPLSGEVAEGQALLDAAKAAGVLVGGAPDTFLGAGLQTVRRLVDEGAIGEPVAASGAMLSSGHESWHPNPAFYYQPGAGPMLDMGPYYVTALVSILGPVTRVSSLARASFPTRTITSEPRRGEVIEVNTPSHVAALLEFAAGPIGSLTTSFDTWDTDHALLTIYGSAGSIRLPDPNTFGGPVQVLRAENPREKRWEEVPLEEGFADNARGLGVADLARALRTGESPRASGEMAFHVLEVMHATLRSGELGEHIAIGSTMARPAPLELAGL